MDFVVGRLGAVETGRERLVGKQTGYRVEGDKLRKVVWN